MMELLSVLGYFLFSAVAVCVDLTQKHGLAFREQIETGDSYCQRSSTPTLNCILIITTIKYYTLNILYVI